MKLNQMSPTCNAISISNMPNPRQQKIAFEACLVGQVFFISSTAYKADYIAKNIVLLGGRTELFFSKNVTSLLVDDYYVNEFKTHYQKFSQNVSIPETKADIANQCNPTYHFSKTQELMNLGPSTHFQSSVSIPPSFPTSNDLSKIYNYNQNPPKNDGYAKFGLLTAYPTGKKTVDHFGNHCQTKTESLEKFPMITNCPPNADQFGKYSSLPYYQSGTNELKKLAMLTACTAKDSEHTGFAPNCYQSTKFIPLDAVQTYNNGLGAVSISSSRGYSVFMSSKVKQDKIMQEHSVFRLMQRAQQWGITILGICQFMKSVEMYFNGDFNKPKRRARTPNKVMLSGCFLKVEDTARKYKAFYKILKEDPVKYLPLHNKFISRQVEIYGSAIKFVAEILNVIEGLLQGTLSVVKPTIETKSKARKAVVKAEPPAKVIPKGRKKQSHFCECCNVYFSDFTHVFSDRHKAFANNERNYECIKDVMRTLPTLQDFLHKNSQSSETEKNSLPVCDKPQLKNEGNCLPEEISETAVVSALDYTKKGLCQHKSLDKSVPTNHPYHYPQECNKTVVEESGMNIIDLSIDKCLLFDELAALGTLTPTIDDSQIKFEFDDCWIDPLCTKDCPGEFNDDRFREFSEHCEKLLAKAQILPANDVAYMPAVQGPSTSTQCLFLDSQESWKNDSNSTALNLSRFQPNSKEEIPVCNHQTITPDFSSTSQTNDKSNLPSKNLSADTKVTNSDIGSLKKLDEPKSAQATEISVRKSSKPSVANDLSKTSLGRGLDSSVEIPECNSNILPVTEKRMFSSESSEEACGRNALIGDVLTMINSSEVEQRGGGDVNRKQACSKAQSQVPVESTRPGKKSRRKHLKKRKLPSLWSVSIVPSKTIRMKFTCLPDPQVIMSEPGSSGDSSIYPEEDNSDVL